MKNHELLRLQEGINNVSNIKGVKFAYALMKNKKLIDAEIKCLQKGIEPAKEYQEFNQKRIDLCKSHATKDDKNEPVIIDKNYVIGNQENFTIKVNALIAEYKNAIDTYEQQLKEYENLLNENTELDSQFYKMTIDYLPEDISAKELELIAELIA